MKTILLLIVFLVFDSTISCPSGSITYLNTNSCFKFITKPAYFFEADETCVSLGGHLASVVNSFEDGFLQGPRVRFYSKG